MEKLRYILNFNKLLILLFMFIGGNAFGQVTLSLRYLSSDNKYHVYLTPTTALASVTNPRLTDGSSQITLMASTGNLTIGTVTSVSPAGSWDLSTTTRNNGDAASGAPTGKDFFVITPAGDFNSIVYTSGTEVELFNFDVTGTCTGSLDILPAGSQTAGAGTLNIGSYYSVRGYSGGIGTNHFSSTYNMSAACPVSATTAPDLVTTIGQPATPLTVGQPSNVPVTITNVGTAPATGPITTTFTLPTGTTAPASFLSNGSSCTTSGQTVTCSTPGPISNTAPTNTSVINVPVTPLPSSAGTSPQFNATTSAPNEPVANTGNNGANPMTPSTPIAGVPDLITSIGQPTTPLTVGLPSNIPVTVTNVGSAPATGPITTTFTLPTGTTAPASFLSNGSSCTTSGQTVTCSTPGPISNLSPNNTAVINIPVTPLASTVGTNPPFNATTSAPNEPTNNTTNNPATPMTPLAAVVAGNTVVSVKVLLQGAYQSAGLMRDQLRSKNLIPTTEPYTALGYVHKSGGGGETVTSSILAVSDPNNAIVDWVVVELRDATTPSTVIASKSALIQKDGDVVSATDGISAVTFTGVSVNNYYVSVKHRNHLGVMTKTAQNFASTVGLIDFTLPSTQTNGTNPQKVLSDGRLALWAGNTTGDNQVIYSGGSNDVSPIYNFIFNDLANTAKTTTFVKTAYSRNDVNLSGTVVYQGPSNEVDMIMVNILTHPANLVSKSPSYIILEQIP
ncbi:MAG: hypothetical protein MUF58_01130 [Arcicella sp.]|nr:hypothetical protein [Arcicella sp.]